VSKAVLSNSETPLIGPQLIKRLSTTPVINAQQPASTGEPLQDPQAALQANKGTFFFRLERELEKVNTFYLQKEAEVCTVHLRA
jgi:CDK inhibitor PHO81